MLVERSYTMRLLLAQAPALHIRLEALRGGQCVRLSIGDTGTAEAYTAWLCERSSDYWTERVHLLDIDGHINLVVCLKHDSCLPLRVLALDTGTLYGARNTPAWYTPEKRTTWTGSAVFLGQLLSGVAEAYQALDTLPRSTRYRYLARVKSTLKGKRGRPVRVA